jgi:hypothetical protein
LPVAVTPTPNIKTDAPIFNKSEFLIFNPIPIPKPPTAVIPPPITLFIVVELFPVVAGVGVDGDVALQIGG